MSKFEKNKVSGKSQNKENNQQSSKNGAKEEMKSKKWGSKTSNREINDPAWYAPNAQLVKDSASIPYSVFNGVQYELMRTDKSYTTSYETVKTGSQPGIYVYKYVPFIGQSGKTSAINMAMRALYTYVRHANAGHSNYEAPDLMIYILALDSVYLMIHEIVRILKLAYAYNIGNRLIPEKIFEAIGMDISEVTANLANYRSRINQIIAKVNTLAVPADFDLFKRRATLGSVVLTDEPKTPTQIIIPKADIYYKYVATGTTGGKLVGQSYQHAAHTKTFRYTVGSTQTDGYWSRNKQLMSIDEMFAALNDCVGTLISDEDINIMSGDILKAYGNNIHHLEYLDENAVIEFSHDEELLTQFANSTVLDVASASIDFTENLTPQQDVSNGLAFVDYEGRFHITNIPTITQKDGAILCHAYLCAGVETNKNTYRVTSKPFGNLGKAPVRSFTGDTSPERTLESTRLTMLIHSRPDDDDISPAANDYMQEIACGTEIGLGWLVYTTELEKTTVAQWFQFGSQSIFFGGSTEPNSVFMGADTQNYDSTTPCRVNMNIPQIDNAVKGLSFGPLNFPVSRITTGGSVSQIYGRFTISQASEKCALIDSKTLKNMHDVALLGLLKTVYFN